MKDIGWAKKEAWALDCIKRNGKYYFYYPVESSKIGVAVSDKTYDPFKDPLDSTLISASSKGVVGTRDFIDTAVFIDDDGQAHPYRAK